MEHKLYWLWLSLKAGIRPIVMHKLYERFESIEAVFKADDYSGTEDLRTQDADLLRNKDLSSARRVYEECRRLGISVFEYDSPDYPEKLKNITDPPAVIYVRGDISPLKECLSIGVVGTRGNTQYGASAAGFFGGELAKRGVAVVSGMARGIDSDVAKAVLRNGGYTVAVLGCGVDVVYPPENGSLMEDIVKNGALISEYPPGEGVKRHYFPARNRIISGLSDGVLVVEAPKKSGALITARYAADEGRDVFCVPGSILSSASEGCNRFIQQGAKLVLDADDIICEYPAYAPVKKTADEKVPEQRVERPPVHLSGEEKKIVEALDGKDMYIDELMRATGIGTADIARLMIMLEVKGVAARKPGNLYGLAEHN